MESDDIAFVTCAFIIIVIIILYGIWLSGKGAECKDICLSMNYPDSDMVSLDVCRCLTSVTNKTKIYTPVDDILEKCQSNSRQS